MANDKISLYITDIKEKLDKMEVLIGEYETKLMNIKDRIQNERDMKKLLDLYKDKSLYEYEILKITNKYNQCKDSLNKIFTNIKSPIKSNIFIKQKREVQEESKKREVQKESEKREVQEENKKREVQEESEKREVQEENKKREVQNVEKEKNEYGDIKSQSSIDTNRLEILKILEDADSNQRILLNNIINSDIENLVFKLKMTQMQFKKKEKS